MLARRVVVSCAGALAVVLTTACAGGQPSPSTASSTTAAAANSGSPGVNEGQATPRSPRNANYTITARLEPSTRTLTGRETIRWTNITSRPTTELQFHLYWNAWRDNESTWLREQRLRGGTNDLPRNDPWGHIDITVLKVRHAGADAVDLTKQTAFIAPDDGNAQDRTVMRVPLPASVEPNGSLEVEVEWTSRVPRPFSRTGVIGNEYFVAQWFPKLGVLEERGWNTHQFHNATEFFSDYGVYDVRINTPAAYWVGASGTRVNWVENADDTETHQFRGEDIHDFAWVASPNVIDYETVFEHPTLPRVQLRFLMRPERRAQLDRYVAITKATLQRYGEWFGPYPYPNLTVVDPVFQSESDGMEYPMLVTGRSRWFTPVNVQVPESTTAHEVGHQWWYGMVGTNEFEHAWMDEGINTYATARVMSEVMPQSRVEHRVLNGFIPWTLTDIPVTRLDNDRLPAFRGNPEADVPATPTWKYWPASASIISYNKTALWLHTLENHLGWPTMQRVLSTYFERWKFKHPTPDDFFAVLNEVSGQDLSWFVDQVYRSSNAFDYGVQALTSERLASGSYRTTVVARRFGEATFPIDVVTTFANGDTARERWNGLERRVVYVYERDVAAARTEVDPDRVLTLDVDYTNNSRARTPRAAEASVKWALVWMRWLQEMCLTYGFFA